MARRMVLVFTIAVIEATLSAQSQTPRNDLPQPYRTTRDWGQLPPGVVWAAVTAVEPAPDGTIYVIHRCFENSCAGRTEPPILKYDPTGSCSQRGDKGCSSSRTAPRSIARAISG